MDRKKTPMTTVAKMIPTRLRKINPIREKNPAIRTNIKKMPMKVSNISSLTNDRSFLNHNHYSSSLAWHVLNNSSSAIPIVLGMTLTRHCILPNHPCSLFVDLYKSFLLVRVRGSTGDKTPKEDKDE
jgi:hypothetical protein